MIETVSLVSSLVSLLSSASSKASLRASFEQSVEGAKARRSKLICSAASTTILMVGSIVILFGSLVFGWEQPVIIASAGTVLILSGGAAVLGVSIYLSAISAFAPQAALDVEKKLSEEQEKLARDTTLPALLRYNREQMALYHQIATTQARAAGRNSQVAMSIGFLALIAGAVVAIASDNTVTKLVTGGLAALGGIFSGYITKTFFVAQDKAIGQLYNYWEQPLTTSYLLTAERISTAFSDGQIRDQQLGKLVDQLLNTSPNRKKAGKLGTVIPRARNDNNKPPTS
jgi:hypothetical protein